ncbi:unnamed protein product [Linum trigynum]|uniref:Uncharacterized protein n=1 Tax=Linum trigynum TaxID=586398 RepID=A0AAV2E263_9ROSI
MNGRTTPWRKKQKQNQTRNSYCEGWILLLDVDRHFSKLKLASNGVEDQARALEDSCSSLSLSRNRSLSLKLQSPSVWLKICLKGHHWPKHGRGHGRALPQPARALASVNYTASAQGETRPCFGGTRSCFGGTRPCFVPVFWLDFANSN